MPKSPIVASLPALALGAALIAGTAPAAASEGDLAPYFERLRTTSPSFAPSYTTSYRPAASRYVHRPVHQVYRPAYPVAHSAGRLDIATLERTVFNHINLYRLSKGMRPLAEHPGLAATARSHSAAMASGAAAMNHAGMQGRLMPHMGSFGYRAGGEILAFNRGMGDPAQTAMRSWLSSYRHKDVIEEDYTSLGVGIAQRADGAYYFTALFIR